MKSGDSNTAMPLRLSSVPLLTAHMASPDVPDVLDVECMCEV